MIDFRASRWFSAILFVALALSTDKLSASGLDDAIAGRSALEQNRYDDAIRLFTKAINSTKLPPRQLAGAYYGRGNAYAEKHVYALAIADFGETFFEITNCFPIFRGRSGFDSLIICPNSNKTRASRFSLKLKN
jgi:tetratricopeptide (TPR) repeat protein